MKITTTLALVAGLAALAACKQNPQQNAAENIEANAENTAENITAVANNEAENIQASAANEAAASAWLQKLISASTRLLLLDPMSSSPTWAQVSLNFTKKW